MFILDNVPSITIDRSQLMEMLKRENEIRMSPETQEVYTNMRYNWGDKDEDYDLFTIDRQIQLQVIREFGYNPAKDDSLEAYQLSCGLWLEDEEVKECVVWMKYDFMRLGSLLIRDLAPEATVCTLDGKTTLLSSFQHVDRPLVLVGGSYS